MRIIEGLSLFSCSIIQTRISRVIQSEVSQEPYTNAVLCIVSEGDRVAQLIIEKIETPPVLEVQVSLVALLTFSTAQASVLTFKDLEETLRGAGGFGSTGGHGAL